MIPFGHCHCGCGQRTKLATKGSTARGWVKGEPLPYLKGHRRPKSTQERLLAGREVTENGCWRWTGSLRNDRGYGAIYAPEFKERGVISTHRVAYMLLVGPIPEGLEIDHLCGERNCFNPAHLEAVTHAENVRRGRSGEVNSARESAKTHCKRGHPYDEANTYLAPGSPHRQCRTCRREVYNPRKRAKAVAA